MSAEGGFTPDALLGRGWRLPLRVEANRVALVSGPDTVAQSIWTILATAPGERVGRPDFGCGIHDLVFETSGGGTPAHVAEQVRVALDRWEPRIELLAVAVDSRPAQATLLIRVEYRMRGAPGEHNLVFPFYLEGAT